ncbi:MAG: protein kinase [Planctomycetales bacterium]|nr:protein kinase [Planctomycetales bacterium]
MTQLPGSRDSRGISRRPSSAEEPPRPAGEPEPLTASSRPQANRDDASGDIIRPTEINASVSDDDLTSQRVKVKPRQANAPAIPGLPATLGGYRIVREVGRGGMGVVFEALDTALQKKVAVKVLPQASLLHRSRLARFQTESQAAGRLTHPHIVPVFTSGVDGGFHYYVMQFVEGCDFSELIRSTRRIQSALQAGSTQNKLGGLNDTTLQPSEAPSSTGASIRLRYSGDEQGSTDTLNNILASHSSHRNDLYYRVVAEACAHLADALGHAHEAGVVHRDIKPGNILLDTTGHVWVTDFGLAQLNDQPGQTQTGDILGTLRYMSPEQALGKRVMVDNRADIYSLGATMYELLTLQPAHNGRTQRELLRQIAFVRPTPPRRVRPDVPKALELIVLKALEKNPDDRYQTGKELHDDLRRFLRGKAILGRPIQPLQRALYWLQQHRMVAGGLAAAVLLTLLLLVGSSYALFQGKQDAIAREQDQRQQGQKTAGKLRRSEARRIESVGRRLHALGALEAQRDPGLAMALLQEAAKRIPVSEMSDTLLTTMDSLHELRMLPHTHRLAGVAASPDGRLVLTWPRGPRDEAQPSVLWRWQEGVVAARLHADIQAAAFNSRSDRILALTRAEPPALQVHNLEGDALRKLPESSLEKIGPRSFHPQGDRIVIDGDGNDARIYDFVSGDTVTTLVGQSSPVAYAAYVSEKHVVTVGQSGAVCLHHAVDGKLVRRFETGVRFAEMRSVELSRDGRLAIGPIRGPKWWDLMEEQGGTADPPSSAITGAIPRWLGSDLLVTDNFETLDLWDAQRQQRVAELAIPGGPAIALVVSPDSRWVAVANSDHRLHLWNAQSQGLRTLLGHRSQIVGVQFIDEHRLVSASSDGECRVWDLRSGRERSQLAADAPQQLMTPPSISDQWCLWPLERRDCTLLLSENAEGYRLLGHGRFDVVSKSAALIDGDTITAWSGGDAEKLGAMTYDGADWSDGKVSDDGAWLAGGSERFGCWVQRTRGGFPRKLGAGSAIAFRPASAELLLGDRHGRLQHWDLESDTLLGQQRLDAPIVEVRLSQDGGRVGVRTTEAVHLLPLPLDAATSVSSIQEHGSGFRFADAAGAQVVRYVAHGVGKVTLLQSDTGELIAQTDRALTHARVRTGSDGKLLIASGEGVMLWAPLEDPPAARVVTETPCRFAAFAADGSRILALPGDFEDLNAVDKPPAKEMLVFDAREFQEQRRIRLPGNGRDLKSAGGHTWMTLSQYGVGMQPWGSPENAHLEWGHASPIVVLQAIEGNRAVSVSRDGELLLWDAQSGQVVQRDSLQPKPEAAGVVQVSSGAVDARRSRLALATADGDLIVRSLLGEHLATVRHDAPVHQLQFTPTGDELWLVDGNGQVVRWAWNEEGATLGPAFRERVAWARFGRDSVAAVLVERARPDSEKAGNRVLFYDAGERTPLEWTVEGGVAHLDWDQTEKRIAILSNAGEILVGRLEKAQDNAEATTLRVAGASRGTRQLAWGRDDRLLTSTPDELTLWDLSQAPAPAGSFRLRLRGRNNRLGTRAAMPHPDGQSFLLLLAGGAARQLPLDLQAEAAKLAPRLSTDDVRARFQVGDEP